MRRWAQLGAGLAVFAAGLWLGLQAGLGVGPWDVLHGGLSERLGTPFGRTAIAVGVVVLLVSLRAGVRPGVGTVANVVVIGAVLDLLLATPLLDGLGSAPLPLRLAVTAAGMSSRPVPPSTWARTSVRAPATRSWSRSPCVPAGAWAAPVPPWSAPCC